MSCRTVMATLTPGVLEGMYNETINVNATGSVECEFKSVSFRASVETYAKNGPAAKEAAQKTIDAIRAAVLKHADKAKIDTDRLRTTFEVSTYNDRHSGDFKGYKAVYTIRFTGFNVTEAIGVHDALTSIPDVQSPTPVFNFDDSPEIQARAFEKAVQKAQAKFESQCKALNLKNEDFRLLGWSLRDEQSSGKFISFNASGGTGRASDIEPGKATFDVQVTLTYQRNNPAAKP